MYKEWHKEYHGVETVELGNIGFVTYSYADNVGTIYDLFITKEYRHTGWALHLLHLVKKLFLSEGIDKAVFQIQSSNKENSRFVEKLALSISSDNWVQCIHDSYEVNL